MELGWVAAAAAAGEVVHVQAFGVFDQHKHWHWLWAPVGAI